MSYVNNLIDSHLKTDVKREARKQQFLIDYKQLPVGQCIKDRELGIRLQRVSGKYQHRWKVTKNACERLVAKIAYETAFVALEPRRWLNMPVLDHLAEVAFGVAHLDPLIFGYPTTTYYPIGTSSKDPKYYHQIIIEFKNHATIVNVFFFGCVGFRLRLRGDDPCAHGPLKLHEENLDMLMLLMTFEPGKNKRKLICFKRTGCDSIEEASLNGRL